MKIAFFASLALLAACSSDPDVSKGASSDASADTTSMDVSQNDGTMMDAPKDVVVDSAQDGGVCKPGGDAGPTCFQCCDSQIPNAKDSFRAVLSNCMPSMCANECATELMAQPPYPPPLPGSACEKCVFGLVDAGSSCVKQMKTDCGSQASCVGFVVCMDDCVRR